jgi:hypothetical protein
MAIARSPSRRQATVSLATTRFCYSIPLRCKGVGIASGQSAVDGEIVAIDAEGKPSFNALQNDGSSKADLYYVSDVVVLSGKDLTGEPLGKRRELLETKELPKLDELISYSPALEARLGDLPSDYSRNVPGSTSLTSLGSPIRCTTHASE